MTLPETFERIQPSIVALLSRVVVRKGDEKPAFPDVIGTGFIVDPRGIVATNRHVIDALQQLPPHPLTGKPSAAAMLFLGVKATERPGQQKYMVHFADVKSAFAVGDFSFGTEAWFGQSVPDLGFAQIHVRDVPALELATEPYSLRIGLSIGTAGYPLGSAALAPSDRLMQVTPTLRHGIISSLHPAPMPQPHGFTIDAAVQAGASGSPIFPADSPTVIGMIYGTLSGSAPDGRPENTNLTFALPSQLIKRALESFVEVTDLDFTGIPSFERFKSLKDEEISSELTYDSFRVE